MSNYFKKEYLIFVLILGLESQVNKNETHVTLN
jgi:hypothetical protein